MDPHQFLIAKPKISKNASSKLPEAFRMQTIPMKKQVQPVEEQKPSRPQSKQQPKDNQKQLPQKKSKKSKNPFLPIKQFFKYAEEFAKQMKEVKNDINNFGIDRLSKYNYDHSKDKHIKYENCITLSVIRKNASGSLRKVLHVPTLSMHFMKQFLISTQFDKNQINEWISIVNQQSSSSCIKICQLFWNMPEDHYTLLYQYNEGILLDFLNDSLNTIPLPILKEVALAHLNSNISIFNSQLILNEESGVKKIRYLPMYEESELIIGQSNKMKSIIQAQLGQHSQNDQNNAERRFKWRLGLILLNGYLGSVILSQDVEKVVLPIKKCCLLHEILSYSASISSLFISLNSAQDEALIDFVCKCLHSKKMSEKQGRVDLKSLRRHPFLSKKYNEMITLKDMITVVDPSSSIKSKFQISKMSKIMDSIGLTLQNQNEGVFVDITTDNKGVVYLSKQLGMIGQIDKVITELKRVYRGQKS